MAYTSASPSTLSTKQLPNGAWIQPSSTQAADAHRMALGVMDTSASKPQPQPQLAAQPLPPQLMSQKFGDGRVEVMSPPPPRLPKDKRPPPCSAFSLHSSPMSGSQGIPSGMFAKSAFVLDASQCLIPPHSAPAGRAADPAGGVTGGRMPSPLEMEDAAKSKAPGVRSYVQLFDRLPEAPTQESLIHEFLRDELRSLLKANKVSYHKGGPQNLMKSKAEMASDLMQLIRERKLSRNPPVNPDESGDKAKPKKRRKRKADSQTTDTRRLLELQSKRALLSSPQLGPRSSPTPPTTPRMLAAVDIILAFPPTTPRSRQRIIENMGSAEGGDKTAAHGPALLRRTPIVTPTLKRHAMEPSAAAAAAAAAAAGPTFANALALGPQGPLQLRAPALR